MDTLKQFLKVTLIGGLLFLVPVALLLVLLGHAMKFAAKIATPLAAAVPESLVPGKFVATALAVLVLLLIAFAAGLAARSDHRSEASRGCAVQ